MWYPERGRDTAVPALRICSSCPVRLDRLDAALDEEAVHGYGQAFGIRADWLLTPARSSGSSNGSDARRDSVRVSS